MTQKRLKSCRVAFISRHGTSPIEHGTECTCFEVLTPLEVKINEKSIEVARAKDKVKTAKVELEQSLKELRDLRTEK